MCPTSYFVQMAGKIRRQFYAPKKAPNEKKSGHVDVYTNVPFYVPLGVGMFLGVGMYV